MVNATVDNEAISIELQDGESTTVPAGEVWKVTISVSSVDANWTGTAETHFEISNTPFVSGSNSGEDVSNSSETVLTGGDTITCVVNGGENQGGHIGGFVVNN